MATIVLSAAGAAAGAAIGGNVLGLSSVVIGRAVGATLGYMLDRKLMGQTDQQVIGVGSETVETGKVERFRLQGAQEGAPVAQVYGRVRRAGQVIWATRFKETVTVTGGGGGGGSPASGGGGSGKGGQPQPVAPAQPSQPKQKSYSYSVSLAVAVCEGEITGIGRIWADGTEVRKDSLTLRVYRGTEGQQPDPKIEAVQGAGEASAYRGIAYVVIEDLELAPFGNRVPQFSFEVLRPEPRRQKIPETARGTRAVALIPGTGEYALATEPVYFDHGPGRKKPANLNNTTGATDFIASLRQLKDELPRCKAVSLVVSWFGDDLRCGRCTLRPMVEQGDYDSAGMPWSVSGLARGQAQEVPREDGRPVYGGTPSDLSVIQSIRKMRDRGLAVNFYPFILMTQMPGNGLTDPWTGKANQPHLPWRGRITTGKAPMRPGTPDRTADADDQVAAFFGNAGRNGFAETGGGIDFTGDAEWSYRRFILHYAHLCKAAGGVDSFCIGSEMRALTQIRGANDRFPAVDALCDLVEDVRHVLGHGVKIGYAADWSEYFGYQPQDGSGDVYFHLDKLWAHPEIDFIGIDNYMPLSDWRDGSEHADAGWGSIYDLDYLKSNVAGGEGYDWYYESEPARRRQERRLIADVVHGEPWVYRYKDLKGWWSNPHHERIGGVRKANPTGWQPQSKPIWFTELGCGAIDKGTNQPNKFIDPKSSESMRPHFSTGKRDEYIQMQYLRAMQSYWAEPENNPTSAVYGDDMVDMSRAYVWAWDARPYPFFPGRRSVWSDGRNYSRGHWINGRTANRSLAGVVEEICKRSGVTRIDTSRLYGMVRGYTVSDTGTARSALQPLMLAYGFDAIEEGGKIVFRTRSSLVDRTLDRAELALHGDLEGDLEAVRAPEAELSGRHRIVFTEADGDYEARAAEAVAPDEATHGVSQSDLPLVLTKTEGKAIAERWLAEARIARDRVRFALPPSDTFVRAGDVVTLETEAGQSEFRIDRIEQSGAQLVEAVRTDGRLFAVTEAEEEDATEPAETVEPAPVLPVFMDLPLLSGDEVAHAPHLAVVTEEWSGPVAVYRASGNSGYQLIQTVETASVAGFTETAMVGVRPGVIDRGPALRVRLVSGALESVDLVRALNGANAAAIGDMQSGVWEVFQFVRADLVGERVYDLSLRLRGQAGTDGVMPAVWPAGSAFVLLDARPEQVPMPLSERGLDRHYRVGPAEVPHDHPAYVHEVHGFDGIGLRPYAPAHLRVRRVAGGDLAIGWVRRTRIDGDSWAAFEVPLGEERERYEIRILQGADLVRSVLTEAPGWTYTAALQAGDGLAGAFEIAVAQVSDQFGPGPFRRIAFHV